MKHRRFLAHPEAHRPFADGNLHARIGGPAAVGALVDTLYDRIENDAALRPLFGRDLTGGRQAQKRFFSEWLGGAAPTMRSGWRLRMKTSRRWRCCSITARTQP
jgi:truncated hemoglobin YjbI